MIPWYLSSPEEHVIGRKGFHPMLAFGLLRGGLQNIVHRAASIDEEMTGCNNEEYNNDCSNENI